MKLNSYSKVLLIKCMLGFCINYTTAQCPGAEICEDSYVFCSLDQLNGFSCSTPSQTKDNCRSGCAGNSGVSNRTWWALISNGGNVSITLNVGNCTMNNVFTGLSWGIWGDCNCNEEIKCIPYWVQPFNSSTYDLNLKPCKIYYISIDSGDDNCDFTITTSGGAPPNLFLGKINNVNSGIIEPVCQGYCGYKFFVDHGGCLDANYKWTLDGVKVGGNKPEIKLDFPDAGDFTLCVSATLGNPHNGFICAQQGPSCSTVKVRALADRNGLTRTLCYETANPGGFKWHNQIITSSGIYRENFKDNNCCPYDSVVQFIVLPKPEPPDVYYITCTNTPYVDALGRRWSPCRAQEIIDFPKFKEPFKCDSSIKLTAVNVDFAPEWKAECKTGKIELSPNVKILKACDVGESYEFEYRWYRKTDSLQKTLSTDERLVIDSVEYNYCVDVKVKVRLGTAMAVCSKTFCDTINKLKALGSKDSIKLFYCDSAEINKKSYTQSDTFIQQLTNVFGCDSLVFTDLTISKSSTSKLQENECDSVSINGKVYYQSGTYLQTLQNSKLCDSIITLDLIIEKSSHTQIKQSQCDSISINAQTYFQTGNYQQRFSTSLGCDSVLHLELNIPKSSYSDLTLRSCDSLVLVGTTYFQSSQFIQQLKNELGCDSIVQTELIIDKSSNSDLSLRQCDSVIINNLLYTLTGDYTQNLIRANGCDSVLQLHLDIPKSSSNRLVLNACDSIKVNTDVYKFTGIYNQIHKNASGCDSNLILELSIYNSYADSLFFSDCDSVVFKGQTYKISGLYPLSYQRSNGCDSIIHLHINIPGSNTTPYQLSACDSATINGTTYTRTGMYNQKLISANGCDSTLTIDLNIFTKTAAQIMWAACDSALINGIRYTQSGKYTQLLKNTYQCDSVLDIDLNLSKSTSERQTLSSCDSVLVNGQLYSQSRIYTQLLKNTSQCDSILTIDFTRLQKTTNSLSYKSCDSAVINGQVYTASGNYIQTLVNANACDSILNLQLEITKSSSENLSIQQCDSVEVNGQVYTQSGNYTQVLQNAAKCDSVLTLNIDILKQTTSTHNQTSCDSVNINNQLYTTTGVYNQVLKNTNGCDSILSLDLVIHKSSSGILSQTSCDSAIINNVVYKASGMYTQVLKNTYGCDSTLTLDLSIKPGNPTSLDAGKDTSLCDGDILKLNALFTGTADFTWQSSSGRFDNASQLSTNYYPATIGNQTIYLRAADDCRQWLDSINLLVIPKQIISVTGDTIIDPCKEITFKASGGTNYIWTPSSLIDCLDPPCSIVKLKATTATRFTITTQGPCVIPANLNLSFQYSIANN
jgi:hypothetical protein